MNQTTIAPNRSRSSTARRYGRTGAPLWPPVISYALLTVLAAVLPSAVAGVRPWSSDAALLTFFREHNGAAHLSAFLTLGSAIPLAVVVAVATSRLRTLGLDVPGRIIAQVGGTVAAAMLALAGVTTLAATQDHVAESAASLRLLNSLTYAAGGPGFVVFSGLLVAGVSVVGLIGRALPRAVGWFGLVLAVVCEVASLAAAFDGMSVLLPVGRFGGLLWLLVIATTLPMSRRRESGQPNQSATAAR